MSAIIDALSTLKRDLQIWQNPGVKQFLLTGGEKLCSRLGLIPVFVLLFCRVECGAAEVTIRQLKSHTNEAVATVRVLATNQLPYRIPRLITGKFAEHLGENIYNGMLAEILRNPTFADYPFAGHEMSPDGVLRFLPDQHSIELVLRQDAAHWGWPETELGGLTKAYQDGLAAFWTREGPITEVEPSPDTGPFAGRAQRVQVKNPGQGIAQWTFLPLHRVRRYEFELFARSLNLSNLTVSLTASGSANPRASASINGLSGQWQEFKGGLELDRTSPPDSSYKVALTADAPGQFVIQHFFLQPADNVSGADPDIIRLLRQSHLPLLRWPGGNFVSGYHWQDGVGAAEARPTKPNYAWGAVEPNLFGTDEFIEFCHAVGCEPMICINAGTGTPEEAAQWIEYCNGPATSPMGKWRAGNGHPEPYHVQYWEVGNELWGRWQFDWTTAAGYVDRYRRFVSSMQAADPNITLLACGAPVLWGKSWNDTLIAGAASQLRCITDHPLIGGTVSPTNDPLDVYRDFMAVPEVLEGKWSALREDMLRADIQQPHLAITELQLFAHLGSSANLSGAVRLTPENLPSQGTMTEAIYDVLVYHAAVRLSPFVELITHTAIVNHGGGLRKERERVYANPCHYAQAEFSRFAGARPVPVEITSTTLHAPRVLSDLREHVAQATYSSVDALAAVISNGDLLLSLVNRNTKPVQAKIELDGFSAKEQASVVTLAGSVPWAANTLTNPVAITPQTSAVGVNKGQVELRLEPFSVVQLSVAPSR